MEEKQQRLCGVSEGGAVEILPATPESFRKLSDMGGAQEDRVE